MTVLLREQAPGDREHLAELFAGLSDHSRYLRFATGIPPALPRRYLDALADVDGDRHVGILAVRDGRTIGAARYIREQGTPAEAEVAVTVADAFQRRGLGRLLVETLVGVGAERGIERFGFEILPVNRPALALARRLGAGDRFLATRRPLAA